MASRSREENARLDRLAGSGEGRGGGLPLPLLFAAILDDLLDNGPATTDRLTGITSATLEFKANQVMSTWPSWESLTGDVLAQLEAKDIIQAGDGVWQAGPALKTGVHLEVIPTRKWKGRKYPADGVTVWEKEERELRSKADHAEHEATSLVGRFRAAAPDHVSEIRQSEAQVGQLYPVLVDQHGRILDGGHRKAANPNWREHKIKVDSEEMALAIGLWANRGKPLPARVQARVTELIGELAGSNQVKRDRAKAALLADPSRSNRDIARDPSVNCDKDTIADVRRELEHSGEIRHYEARGGKAKGAGFGGVGLTTGTPAPPAPPRGPIGDIPAARAEVHQRRRSGKPVRRQQIAQQFGVSEVTVRALAAEPLADLDDEDMAELEPEVHAHTWGPWIRVRQCLGCDEREIEE